MILTLDSDKAEDLELIRRIAERMGIKVLKKEKSKKSYKEAKRSDKAIEALEKLAEYGTFKAIDDPVEWQREIRKDKPLTGRDD